MPSSIWFDQKLIFIHPIKTAGTSLFQNLKEAIGPGDFNNDLYPHRSLWEIFEQYPGLDLAAGQYLKVMTVRHPVARIRSWIRWHVTHGGPFHSVEMAMTHVPSLVRYGLERMDRIIHQETYERDVGALEDDLGLELGDLHFLNKSNRIDVGITPEEFAFIENRFRRDVDLIEVKKWERDDSPRLHRTFDVDGLPSGWLATLWNADFDSWRPDQVYLTVVTPGARKGPHLHAKRFGRFFCIRGRIRMTTRSAAGVYERRWLDSADPEMFEVPTGVACELRNFGEECAYLLNMPTPGWRPDDQDELPIDNWDPPEEML